MVTSVLLCVLYQSDFSKVADPHREQVTLGQICQKGRLFFEKKRSDRAQVHLVAVSMCLNHVDLDDCCGTLFCAETALVRHHSASNF